jgi:multiple sugar transport system permease protein
MQHTFKARLQSGIIYTLLVGMTIFALGPIYWVTLTSFKTLDDTWRRPISWIPNPFTVLNYTKIWSQYPLLTYLLNSLIIAACSVAISLSLGALAGYGLSRYHIKGKTYFMTFTLLTQLFPYVSLILPYYRVFNTLGMLNTTSALVITHVTFGLPFCIWMMKSFIDGIPMDLDDAAKVDGASPLQTFWMVITPVIKPGLAATAVYAFLVSWNEYIFALVLTNSAAKQTVTVGLASLIGMYRINWNDLMTMGTIVSLPAIIMFFFVQNYLVRGLTAGAVKG